MKSNCFLNCTFLRPNNIVRVVLPLKSALISLLPLASAIKTLKYPSGKCHVKTLSKISKQINHMAYTRIWKGEGAILTVAVKNGTSAKVTFKLKLEGSFENQVKGMPNMPRPWGSHSLRIFKKPKAGREWGVEERPVKRAGSSSCRFCRYGRESGFYSKCNEKMLRVSIRQWHSMTCFSFKISLERTRMEGGSPIKRLHGRVGGGLD